MYMKVILYSSLLIISNAFQPYNNHYYPSMGWSKLGVWYEPIKRENLFFLNESIFDEDPVPQYAFFLKIEKSSIPILPPNAFKKCTYMRGAFMSDINITTASPGVFDGVEYLAEIDLSKNKLTQVENGVFNNVSSLQYLDLSYNHIKNLSEQSFSGLKNLKYLYLQGNELSFLYNDLFESQANSLLKLDLSANRFTEITVAIEKLSHLTHLFLQTNNISNIARDSLKKLTSLQFLDFSYNNIQNIQELGLEKLNNLSLQNNKISFLDPNLFDLQKKSITVLNLSSNNLTKINTIFQGMNYLTHLYLQVNNISTLPQDSFQNLSALQHLDLSHNCITDLPEHIFSGSEAITHIYLHNNKINFLDPNLFESQRHSLILLNLSSNTLREIRSAFRGLNKLTNLYLQENQISSTDVNSFQDVNSLEYLDISHNNLERFQHGLLDHLDHLKYLNFSYNKFEEFPLVFLSYLTNLEELVFDNNKIKSLNGTEILQHFPYLQKIGLSGNFKWPCTKLVTLVRELRIKKIEIVKGNYFSGANVRGMACDENHFVSNDKDSKSDTQSKHSKEIINTKTEKCNNEIHSNYSDKNIKDLIHVILEKHDSGNTFITILITISTLALIVMTCLQLFFVIKLKRNAHEENLELL